MRRWTLALILAALAASFTVAGQPEAFAADASGAVPNLTVDDTPKFIVGKPISESGGSDQGDTAFPDWTTVPISQNWRATAPEGINHYEADVVDDAWFEPNWTNVGLRTSSEYTNSDYNSEYGGGGYGHTWNIKAVDNSGDEAIVKQEWWQMNVIQEDGGSPSMWTPPSITFGGGTWGTSACECFSGGGWERTGNYGEATYHAPQTRFTKVKGAAVTYKATFYRGDHFGIVMPMSAGRGKANIVINGTVVATVNTYSATTKNRMVMWQKWMPAGVHTIKVVNLATAGHPRIDIDAFLYNG